MKKLISLLLVMVLTVSLLCTGAYASGLSDFINGIKGNLANSGGVSTMSITPDGTSTTEVSTATIVPGTTAGPVNVHGAGGSVVFEPRTDGTTAVAYLYGTFSSAATTVKVGAGWEVHMGDTASEKTTINAETSGTEPVYGIYVSGGTVYLESGKITATNHNNATGAKAYGVYGDANAAVYMGSAASNAGYAAGTGIISNGTAGNYGLTVIGARLFLYQGEVSAQGINGTAVYVSGASTLTAVGGCTANVQGGPVFYAHTGNDQSNTALSITEGTTWSITGCGEVFEGYTAMSAFSAGTLGGGTFISHGGYAISCGYIGSIQTSLQENCYLRSDAGIAANQYPLYSNGTRGVSSAGKTATGTLTVTDAQAELKYSVANPAAVNTTSAYMLPCDVNLTAGITGLVTGLGSHSLDMNGKNLTYSGSGDATVDVITGSTLTLTDSMATGYTNLGGSARGVIRTAATGSAVKVQTGGFLNLGSQNAYGPMISAVNADTGATVVGVQNAGTVIAYSCGIYGTYAGADTSGTLFDVKAATAGGERAMFSGKSYGLRQSDGNLKIAGGIFTIDAQSGTTNNINDKAPWALYVTYGTNHTNAAATTAISGGYFYSVATDGMINGRNLMLGDLMASNLSFVDNQTVNTSTGLVTKPTIYRVAAPAVMHGSDTGTVTSKGDWDKYQFYGYAIYGGMNAASSQTFDTATGLHAAALSSATFSACFTVGSNTVYDNLQSTNKKVCTCCGAEYTGTSCPNCAGARCSVCGKCPNHCTCKNTNLISDDHFAYIKGYSDGTFRPTGSLTRAESATIFYRLLANQNYTSTVTFKDVNHRDWYYTAVSCLASKGIISGYSDGSFRPNGKVTRAEFCAMASRFFSIKDATIHFTDVPTTYWAHKYIASAVAQGWINDSYGRFYPDVAITRQEVAVFVNNMTNRVPDQYFIGNNLNKLVTFRDVPASNPNYYDIIEAANGHTYTQSGGVETWKALK